MSTESKLNSFNTDEMILCDKCKRNNPPTRLDCVYCGKELEVSESQRKQLKPVLMKIEPYEKGFNLIYLGSNVRPGDVHLAEVAKMIRIEEHDLERLAELHKSLPLARSKSKREVGIVVQRLAEMEIETVVLEDECLNLEQPARRLRRMEFLDEKVMFECFNNGKTVEINKNDFYLIVAGARFEQKIESTEQYTKKPEKNIVDTFETSADESLIDIYTKNDPIGFRVSANGFDFSCLGSAKGMLVDKNIKELAKKLGHVSPVVDLDDDYVLVRRFLNHVWELEERTDSKGVRRKGLGRIIRKNETITSNLTQFMRYSRMQWHLKNENKK